MGAKHGLVRRQITDSSYTEEEWNYNTTFSTRRQRPPWREAADEGLKSADPYDRADGANWPIYRTDQDIQLLYGIGRSLAGCDATGLGLQRFLLNHIVGEGFEFRVQPRTTAADDTDKILAEIAQRIIDEFTERVNWRRKQREAWKRAFRDGETFIRIYADPRAGGLANVSFVDGVLIRQPARIEADWNHLNWSFGIGTDASDTAATRGFAVDWSCGAGADVEFIPLGEMLHFKRNVDEGCKRGVSDYYPVWQNILKTSRLERFLVTKGLGITAILYWLSRGPNTGLEDVKAEQAGADTRYADGRAVKSQRMLEGTVVEVDNGTTVTPAPDLGAQGIEDVIQAELRAVGRMYGLPEYWSGDASNNNYASILISGAPFVLTAEAEQADFGDWTLETMWRVIELGMARIPSELGATSIYELKRRLKIDYTPPQVAIKDTKTELERDRGLVDAGVMSRRTLAERNGLDYEFEQKLIAEERASTVTPPAAEPITQPQSQGSLE